MAKTTKNEKKGMALIDMLESFVMNEQHKDLHPALLDRLGRAAIMLTSNIVKYATIKMEVYEQRQQ